MNLVLTLYRILSGKATELLGCLYTIAINNAEFTVFMLR